MTTTLIKLKVNGKESSAPDGITVLSFLKNQAVNPNVVACELNLKILKRDKLQETRLRAGDELEIIQMIGGG